MGIHSFSVGHLASVQNSVETTSQYYSLLIDLNLGRIYMKYSKFYPIAEKKTLEEKLTAKLALR